MDKLISYLRTSPGCSMILWRLLTARPKGAVLQWVAWVVDHGVHLQMKVGTMWPISSCRLWTMWLLSSCIFWTTWSVPSCSSAPVRPGSARPAKIHFLYTTKDYAKISLLKKNMWVAKKTAKNWANLLKSKKKMLKWNNGPPKFPEKARYCNKTMSKMSFILIKLHPVKIGL